ncbi:right-handed parallel beta-helix repeat-containing protein [Mesorhizobium sp. M0138]|uniref:right-handed parallel beta-helix repeat-containing protein n=1 Tax=Mesorhizobium sp. M0138 TaxID=2956891 RepID=UPI003338B7A5
MPRPTTAAVRLLTGEREPVRLATTGPIDVDTGGLLTIDGVVTEVGDRVLVKDQTDGSENGIRTASTGQWFRASDARSARTMQKGTTVTVQEGTANAGKIYRFNTMDPVIGDDDIEIVESLLGALPPVVRDYLDVAPYVATRTALKALDTTKDTWVIFDGDLWTFLAGNYSTHVAADTQEGVYVKATAIAATAGAWVRAFPGALNVKWFGAVADDTTDCTAAFQVATNVALLAGPKVIYVPGAPLPYWFAQASAELDPGAGGLVYRGDGWDASILHFEEGTATVTFTAPGYKSLFKNVANTAKGAIRFEGLQFKGTLATDNTRQGGVPVWLDYYSDVVFHACKFFNLTGMAMDIHNCGRAEVTNNWFQDIAADGVRIRDTSNVLVDGNYILRNGDDAIALHTNDGNATTREGLIVTNNHLVNAGTIKCLGGRVIHITGNRIELGNIGAIMVATAVGQSEGNVPLRDIIIERNVILDLLYINSGTPNTIHSGIILSSQPAVGQASTHSTRPGRYDATAAAWVFPWTYDEVDTDDAASVVPPVIGIRVCGNIIRRTRPAVATFSLYGVGTKLWQGVPYNPAITDAHLRAAFGINFSNGSFSDVLVAQNIIECCGNAFNLGQPTYHGQYERFLIARNITRDITNRGLFWTSGSFTQDVTIADNDFDLDTYRQTANSNINGSYAADGVPRGIDIGNITGLKILRNRFRNTCRALSANLVAQLHVEGNLLVGAPASTGFSTSNKGIGVVEFADGRFLYEIIDADPTSATYQQNTNTQQIAASAMPAAGFYVAGAFVRNSLPAAGATIEGWLRMTTGSSHVLGTDWATVGCMKLSGTATFDPASLADGVGATTTVTVTGAALGDAAIASFSLDTQGITITAWVSAANTVSVRFQNESGGVLDIASGTLKATVFKS